MNGIVILGVPVSLVDLLFDVFFSLSYCFVLLAFARLKLDD
ncbi:hypothetical protein [Snodgrassella communis]|nr:hypothetical protein [Snodgrassella communis]